MSNELRPMRDLGYVELWSNFIRDDGRRLRMKVNSEAVTFSAEGEGYSKEELSAIQSFLAMPNTTPPAWPMLPMTEPPCKP